MTFFWKDSLCDLNNKSVNMLYQISKYAIKYNAISSEKCYIKYKKNFNFCPNFVHIKAICDSQKFCTSSYLHCEIILFSTYYCVLVFQSIFKSILRQRKLSHVKHCNRYLKIDLILYVFLSVKVWSLYNEGRNMNTGMQWIQELLNCWMAEFGWQIKMVDNMHQNNGN